MSLKNKHVKSEDRVAKFGEVFTNEKEVNAMIDLVGNEALRVDSRFLEPACGEGFFLVLVLERKIASFANRLKNFQKDFEINLFISVSSLYGIEILPDNTILCRENIFNKATSEYMKFFPNTQNIDFLKSLKFVIDKNIVNGDSISMEDKSMKNEAIKFSEWSLVKEDQVKRRIFQFNDLTAYQRSSSPDLFSDLGDESFIPPVTKEYKPESIYTLFKK